MKLKTKMMADRFAETISKWQGVECISLNEAALPDTLDPYFALIFDIYYEGAIPGYNERCKFYGDDVAAFESSEENNPSKSGESKDRFLVNNLPVHLEFKPLKIVEERVSIADKKLDSIWLIKDSGTYGFYRLANAELVFSRGNWIHDIRKRINNLSNDFWRLMRAANESKMEHFLSDLGAAAIHKDEFNYLISAAGFIKTACLALFCINKRFEPSHRAYNKQIHELQILPESFNSQFGSFLRIDPKDEMERSYHLAKLIARGIVSL